MLPLGKPRVAICFSGQLRTWRKCVDTWHNILLYNGKNDNIDIFCHMWDFNSVPNAVQGSDPMVTEKVDSTELQELINILKPKKVIVESERTIHPIVPDQVITYPPFLSQFYGIMQAARLKREYEISQDIMYDVVVRSRYDAFYSSNLSKQYNLITSDVMEGFHFGWNPSINQGRMGDICWMSDSQTYDIISDYYLNIHTINPKWFEVEGYPFTPESVFFYYIKKNNITINSNNWNIQLFRQSAEYAFSKDKNGFETW
jgi:hypothetical protein